MCSTLYGHACAGEEEKGRQGSLNRKPTEKLLMPSAVTRRVPRPATISSAGFVRRPRSRCARIKNIQPGSGSLGQRRRDALRAPIPRSRTISRLIRVPDPDQRPDTCWAAYEALRIPFSSSRPGRSGPHKTHGGAGASALRVWRGHGRSKAMESGINALSERPPISSCRSAITPRSPWLPDNRAAGWPW